MSSIANSASRISVPFDPNWKTLLECVALEVFGLMARVRPVPNNAPDEEPRGEQTAMVGMAGALCGMTTLRCSKATAQKFAGLMLGGDAASSPSTSRDALGELCKYDRRQLQVENQRPRGSMHAIGSHGHYRRKLFHGKPPSLTRVSQCR